MNVTIQGVTVAYYPDYSPTSQLWKVHLRDAFRIVTLAGTECFVKRFASKPRAWSFMVDCKGKRQTGLPTIYEAKSATEDGKRVYYLILEKIEGDTLHDLMKSKTGGKASVSLMGRALATAFRTIHAQGYWHADFCAKNIMVSASGRRFVMIDLDSLEPTATRPTPTPNEPGYLPDQELAIYALTYVQSYVIAATKSFGAIPGSALNLLQLVFLLDKLIYFSEVLKSKGTKFRDLTAFKELPHLVHQKLGAYTDHLVKRVLAESADSEMIITQPTFFQKELLPSGQTIAWAAPSPPPPPLPTASVPAELVYFRASRHAVLPTQSTQLVWKVDGVASVEITGLGTRPAEGSFIIAHSNSLVGEQIYTLTAAGGTVKGMVKVDFYIPPPLTEPSLPIVAIGFFTASRYAVKAGESTRISWSVTGVSQVHITNIGTVPAVGSHTLAAHSFIGRVEFLLTTNSTAVKKSVFIDFSPKPIVAAPTAWPVVPRQPVPANSATANTSSVVKSPTAPLPIPPAAKAPAVPGAHSSRVSALSTPAVKTPPAPSLQTKKSSGGGMWVAILGLCLLIAGWAWSSSWKSFTPNQLRGLQQFDKEQYDSSFVNLIEFRDDTSYRFATQYNLAYMYDKGKGAIVNDRLAFELYSECLKSSTPEVVSKSLYALGWCYLLGEGCTRDTALAINNFGFAASRFKNLQARVEYERLRKEAAPEVSESTAQKTAPPIAPASLSPSASIESVATDPTIARVTDDAEETVIKRVVQLSNCTRVDFVCTKRQDSHIYLPAPGQPEAPYIEWADLRYKLIRTSGIGNAYGVTYARAGKPRYFSAFFEKIPSGATEINIRDGGDGAWAFYGIKLSFEAWR